VLFSVDFYIIRSSKKGFQIFLDTARHERCHLVYLQYPFAAKFWTFRFSRVCLSVQSYSYYGIDILGNKTQKARVNVFACSVDIYFDPGKCNCSFQCNKASFGGKIHIPGCRTVCSGLCIRNIHAQQQRCFNIRLRALLAVSISQNQLIIEKRFNGPMKEVCSYINSQNITPEDVFIHTDEHTFGTFCYYYPNNKHYLYLPPDFDGYSGYDAFSPAGSYVRTSKNL